MATDCGESLSECALICWWLHREPWWKVLWCRFKVRRYDATTIERMVEQARTARTLLIEQGYGNVIVVDPHGVRDGSGA